MLNKTNFLFILMLLLSVFTIYMTYIPKLDNNVLLNIYQLNHNIKNVDYNFDEKNKKTFFIEKLAFKNNNTLTDDSLGKLGFNKNFFIDAFLTIDVKNDEKIVFAIRSDDGFNFILDGKELFSYKNPRKFQLTKKEVFLKKGKHKIKIRYFQGTGMLGFEGFYKSNGKTQYLGLNSENIKFIVFDK